MSRPQPITDQILIDRHHSAVRRGREAAYRGRLAEAKAALAEAEAVGVSENSDDLRDAIARETAEQRAEELEIQRMKQRLFDLARREGVAWPPAQVRRVARLLVSRDGRHLYWNRAQELQFEELVFHETPIELFDALRSIMWG